ncbi:hypothetical protein Tco_0935629 [Tanacetum coccineum]
MFDHNDTTYGSQYNVGGSSSQFNVGGSSSPVRHFSLDDMETMYSCQLSESFREDSLVEEQEIQVMAPKKKTSRKAEEPRCVPWTIEEEVELCRSWVRISEDSVAEFVAQMDDHKSKRYKSGDSSFNKRESRDNCLNLNNTKGDEEEEVKEVRPRLPMGRDQSKRKGKAAMSSASSAADVDVEVLDSEYECSSLALDREERRDEKKRLDHLKQDQTMLVIKSFSERKKHSRVLNYGELVVMEEGNRVDGLMTRYLRRLRSSLNTLNRVRVSKQQWPNFKWEFTWYRVARRICGEEKVGFYGGEEDEKELVEMGEVGGGPFGRGEGMMEEGYDFASKVLEWLFSVFLSNHERIYLRMT